MFRAAAEQGSGNVNPQYRYLRVAAVFRKAGKELKAQINAMPSGQTFLVPVRFADPQAGEKSSRRM